MENSVFISELKKKSEKFRTATSLEDVLCLAVLIAQGYGYSPASEWGYSSVSDCNDARDFWLNRANGDCETCPCVDSCLAVIINE